MGMAATSVSDHRDPFIAAARKAYLQWRTTCATHPENHPDKFDDLGHGIQKRWIAMVKETKPFMPPPTIGFVLDQIIADHVDDVRDEVEELKKLMQANNSIYDKNVDEMRQMENNVADKISDFEKLIKELGDTLKSWNEQEGQRQREVEEVLKTTDDNFKLWDDRLTYLEEKCHKMASGLFWAGVTGMVGLGVLTVVSHWLGS